MSFHLFLGGRGVEVLLYLQKCSNETHVVDDAGFVVPEEQLERVVGVKDQIGPFDSLRQSAGDELSGFDPGVVSTPKGPVLGGSLGELCADIAVSAGLRSYERKAEEKAAAPDVRPLGREVERSKAHTGTVGPAEAWRQYRCWLANQGARH